MRLTKIHPHYISTSGASANQALIYSSANNRLEYGQVATSGGSSESWSEITSNTTLTADGAYFVDCSSQAITLTLPSSASLGDGVRVIDATGSSETNNITIARNSHKIQGAAEDMTVAQNRAAFKLVYYNSTHGWLLSEV